MNNRYRLLMLILFNGSIAIGGTTGKLTGVAKDLQTAEPIIGVNIVVQGTSMGAATNLDGYYVMLNIPPGKYTLVASAVGYNRKTVSNVSVSGDLTTTIDFELQSSVVELKEEVIVTAQRPLVQKDLTAKTAIVSGDQISALPVTEVGAVLSLQAGFVAGSLRGGRSGEVAYWIDGVPITDSYNGQQVVELNKSIVQELQLVSGAFNAEYGQAMSGIVNIATKEGGPKFTGGAGFYIGQYATSSEKTYGPSFDGNHDTLTSDLFPGLAKFKPTAIRNVEANLSGPLIGEDLTFFGNGRYIYFDGWMKGFRRFNPNNVSYTDSTGIFHLYREDSGKGDSAVVPMNSSERYYGQGKLTWRITSLIKLTGNFIYDYTKSKPYSNFNEDYRKYFYNPDGMGNDYNSSNTFIFQLTHTLSQSTFYTVDGSIFDKMYKHYLYKNPNDAHYVNPKILQTTDDFYSFYTGGTDMSRTNRETYTILTKVDVTSQVNETNMVKAGVEFRKHRIQYDYLTLQPMQSQSDFNFAKDSPYITTQIPDVSSDFHDAYEHRPTELSGYVQDKMEFKNVIVNIGVRFDYFDPDGKVLTDESDPSIYNPIKPNNRFFDYDGNGNQDPGEPDKTVAERRAYWYKKTTAKSQFSPRLGVSFPITARGIVHFSYGHFFQIPRFERLYENPDFKIPAGSIPVVGNADLAPEETVNGELGVQQQLTDDVSLDLTAYLRDIRNLTGTRGALINVFRGSQQYVKYVNSDFGFVKGIVLTVDKRFSGGFDATLDYTFQVARGTASDPKEARDALAGGKQPEVQLGALGWDQRHTLNVTLAYSAATWGVSTIGQYGSGSPYTPRATLDVSSLLTNSQSKPQFFNVDLRTFYQFKVDDITFVAFIRIFNILDIRNETGVYVDTGHAGFTTDEATAKASNVKQRVNSLDQWFDMPTHYSEPRRIEFGMNLEL
jgi:outer membrane receptor for ferrienterochelin and colicin